MAVDRDFLYRLRLINAMTATTLGLVLTGDVFATLHRARVGPHHLILHPASPPNYRDVQDQGYQP